MLLNYDGFQDVENFFEDDDDEQISAEPDETIEPSRKRPPPRSIDFGQHGDCPLPEDSGFEPIPEELDSDSIGSPVAGI
jgi:hypothetical protein